MKKMFFVLILAGLLPLAACETKKGTERAAGPESVQQTEPATVAPAEIPKPAAAQEKPEPITPKNPVVKMVTSKGEIQVELYQDKSPITVENFLKYVKASHYDGTIFHRVISGFMIQGGGFTENRQKKPTRTPIKNETYNKLRNGRGTIAMARTDAPDSATCQFFINHVNNRSLDFDGPYAPGYAVFGEVVEGMDVVDAIAAVQVKAISRAFTHLPVETVLIESVTVIE